MVVTKRHGAEAGDQVQITRPIHPGEKDVARAPIGTREAEGVQPLEPVRVYVSPIVSGMAYEPSHDLPAAPSRAYTPGS